METPRLLADIGATNARFALQHPGGAISAIEILGADDFASVASAINAYCKLHPACIQHAVIAIANPVNGDEVSMTNRNWSFSIAGLREALGLQTLLVVNDFAALARAIPLLGPAQLKQLGGMTANPEGCIGVIGPGSGLGVAGLMPHDGHWKVIAGEGGHVSFAPNDARECDILDYGRQQHEHLSVERLLSGPGLELIHQALAARTQLSAPGRRAAEISQAAATGDALCLEVLDCFSAILGSVAGNLALTLGASGGIYIGGGIVPKLGRLFDEQRFRERFEAKGRFSAYLSAIPCYLILAETPAFIGAAALLDEHLRRH
jgi:glucokinase